MTGFSGNLKNKTSIDKEIKKNKPTRLYILPERPFESNNSHIIGAAETIAGYKEAKIIFTPDLKQVLEPGEAALYWNPYLRQYEVRISDK